MHHFLPGLAKRLARPISQIAGITVVVFFFAVFLSAAPAIWTLVGNGTVIGLAAFVLVGQAIGHFIGGPEPENRAGLALSTGSRHPGVALAIAQANFPDQTLATAALLLYLLVTAVVSIPISVGQAPAADARHTRRWFLPTSEQMTTREFFARVWDSQ